MTNAECRMPNAGIASLSHYTIAMKYHMGLMRK